MDPKATPQASSHLNHPSSVTFTFVSRVTTDFAIASVN
jgi:hypothetical protein